MKANFNVKHFDVIYLIVILFIIIGIVYLMMKKLNLKISRRLIFIHALLTFFGMLVVLIPTFFIKKFELNDEVNQVIVKGIYITIIGQLFFLITIIRSNRKSKNK